MSKRLVATVELPLQLAHLNQVLGALTSTAVGQGENIMAEVHQDSRIGIFVIEEDAPAPEPTDV